MLRNGLSFSGTAPRATPARRSRSSASAIRPTGSGPRPCTATVGRRRLVHRHLATNHIGRFPIRAVIEPAGETPAAAAASRRRRSRSPSTAPRSPPSTAPASTAVSTACGETLHPTTIGVANRTLKCGTKVALYYRGRTMIVPVIDRGPYANHADWDLTQATGQALGIAGIGDDRRRVAAGAAAAAVQPDAPTAAARRRPPSR